MNTYMIFDNKHRYGVEIIIVVADNEEEAFSIIGHSKDETYTHNGYTYRSYDIFQIDTTTKGVKHDEYYGE